MEMKKILKKTSYLMGTKVIRFFIGIIRAKLNAILLGTTGVGIVGQFKHTTEKIRQFILLSTADGMVKQIAEKKSDPEFQNYFQRSLKTFLTFITFVTVIAIIILLIFSKKLTVYFYGDVKYQQYFTIGIFVVPLLVLQSFHFAILKSFKSLKYIAASELITVVIGFITFIPLVIFFKTTGAIIAAVIVFCAQLFSNVFFSKTKILKLYNINYKKIFKSTLSRKNINELLIFAGIGGGVGIFSLFSELFCRAKVVTTLGIDKLGLYAPVMAWGGLYTGFILPALYNYLYPRFSEAEHNSEITGVVNDVFRMLVIFMVPFLFLGISLRNIIIPIFYSNNFLESANFLPWHFIGIFFYMLSESLSQVFTPTGRIKTLGIFRVIMYILDILIVFYFVENFGLYGWMMKFLITPIIFFFVFLIYLNREIDLHIEPRNIKLMIYLLVSSFIIYFFTDYNQHLGIITSLFLLFSTSFFLSENEKRIILRRIRRLGKGDK